MDTSFSKETGGSAHSVFHIFNGLVQVSFKGVPIEVYKGTIRKHNQKFRQIGHTTNQCGQLFSPKTISA